MSDHQGSPQLAAAVSRSEAEARIEAALKVAREVSACTDVIADWGAEDYFARGAALRNIIRILEDGRS